MSPRYAALLLGASLQLAAAVGGAHGGSHDAKPAPAPEVLPPGYGALTFPAPEAGSYALPPLGRAAGGALLASDGTPVDLESLLGERLVLLSFIYASCDDVAGCPLATAVFHRLAARLREAPELARQLRLLSLSFDPARDTPEVMQRYGQGLAEPPVDWRFLTAASEAQLQPLLEAYGQNVTPELGPEGEVRGRLAHVLRVFLIDRERRIRNVYSVSFLHPDTLLADIRTLLMEATSREADAGMPVTKLAGPAPGDPRAGYERLDFETHSRALGARRGQAADLLAVLGEPPLGLPPVPVPADNPPTAARVALGRKLFYDRRLSHNGTLSCGLCHLPEQGFTSNELTTSVGIEGRTVRRNAPSLLNVAYVERLFHDGRETRLEHQVWGPLLARNEMGNPSIGAVLERLAQAADYAGLFEAAFPGRGLALETLGMALASYQRTLVVGDSPFDRWHYGEQPGALSDVAQRGFALFTGRAGCVACHSVGAQHALFSDGAFHSTGVGVPVAAAAELPTRQRIQVAPGRYLEVERALVARVSEPRPADLGRYEITLDPADRWKYRTPSLRNVALTAPYMHDGSLASLDDVLDFYDRGGVPHPGRDPRLRPLQLQPEERHALRAFLESLTSPGVERLVRDAFAAPVGDRGSLTGEAPGASPGHPN